MLRGSFAEHCCSLEATAFNLDTRVIENYQSMRKICLEDNLPVLIAILENYGTNWLVVCVFPCPCEWDCVPVRSLWISPGTLICSRELVKRRQADRESPMLRDQEIAGRNVFWRLCSHWFWIIGLALALRLNAQFLLCIALCLTSQLVGSEAEKRLEMIQAAIRRGEVSRCWGLNESCMPRSRWWKLL